MEKRNNRICYFYDEEVGNYYYESNHPMKPHRMRMAHSLILGYGLNAKMRCLKPTRATATDLTRFHSDEYIQFLQMATPDNTKHQEALMEKFNVGEDSPIFDGLFEFCQITAGGSISAGKELTSGKADIAINWSGGLHHAKKAEASGFCYVADCVLGILELLNRFQRVMYIDIDIHHGDGVEEAFYTTDRVLTVSFHKYGNYFPGTGHYKDIGIGKGRHYAVNVPLKDGITDEQYLSLFYDVIDHCIEWYRPEAILLQCGTDSVTGDRLGVFNLTIKGHGECVRYVKSKGIPLLVTGGGGYTVRNVARTWTYETAILLDEDLDDELPYHEYMGYYGPYYKLHIPPANMENLNTDEQLETIKQSIIESLRHLPCSPGIQLFKDDLDQLFDDERTDDAILYDDRLTGKYLNTKLRLNTLTGEIDF